MRFIKIFYILIFIFLLSSVSLAAVSYFDTDIEFLKTKNLSNFLGQIINFKPYKEPFNVLILGGDKVNKNTDSLMLINFDPKTLKTSMLSIPRDTKVKINGTYYKINAAYPLGGAKKATEVVSNFLNTTIDYYIFLDTTSFKKIIDSLGGLDYYIEENMNYDDPVQNLHIHLKKGYQHLNGTKAEGYMRYRQSNTGKVTENYDGSDLKRLEAQLLLIRELINQKLNINNLPKLREVTNIIFENVETNIKPSFIIGIISDIAKIDPQNINILKLPGHSQEGGSWYYLNDKLKTTEMIADFF